MSNVRNIVCPTCGDTQSIGHILCGCCGTVLPKDFRNGYCEMKNGFYPVRLIDDRVIIPETESKTIVPLSDILYVCRAKRDCASNMILLYRTDHSVVRIKGVEIRQIPSLFEALSDRKDDATLNVDCFDYRDSCSVIHTSRIGETCVFLAPGRIRLGDEEFGTVLSAGEFRSLTWENRGFIKGVHITLRMTEGRVLVLKHSLTTQKSIDSMIARLEECLRLTAAKRSDPAPQQEPKQAVVTVNDPAPQQEPKQAVVTVNDPAPTRETVLFESKRICLRRLLQWQPGQLRITDSMLEFSLLGIKTQLRIADIADVSVGVFMIVSYQLTVTMKNGAKYQFMDSLNTHPPIDRMNQALLQAMRGKGT